MITLRFLHVMLGAYWLGAVLVFAFFLLPSARAVGPAAAPMMDQMGRVRKLPIVMMLAAILTILTGLGMMYINSSGFTGPWMQSSTGRVFSLGGGFGILAAIVGMSVTSPAGKAVAKISGQIAAQGGPPTAEQTAALKKLQEKFGLGNTITTVLVFLAASCMAVARYV